MFPPARPARIVATPTSRFASPTSTTRTKPFGDSIPRCVPSRPSTSVGCECSSSTTLMTHPSRFSSCPAAHTPPWSSGAPPVERDGLLPRVADPLSAPDRGRARLAGQMIHQVVDGVQHEVGQDQIGNVFPNELEPEAKCALSDVVESSAYL